MAKPDFIPDGQKWDHTAQKFVPLQEGNINDIKLMLDQERAKVEALKGQLAELEAFYKDKLKHLAPPDFVKRANEYETEIASLKKQVLDLVEDRNGYKREADAYKKHNQELTEALNAKARKTREPKQD